MSTPLHETRQERRRVDKGDARKDFNREATRTQPENMKSRGGIGAGGPLRGGFRF